MRLTFFKLVIRSVLYYRKAVLYQFLTVMLLSAIITGSLLTGFSVRKSIISSAVERLGAARIIVSSGLRYFNPGLANRLNALTGAGSASILSASGITTGFSTGKQYFKTRVYGITGDFFSFMGDTSTTIEPGKAVLNSTLANHLGIREGDEIILKAGIPVDIPANAPFAPEEGTSVQKVLVVSRVLEKGSSGDFSPEISQVLPGNIFVNITDLIPEPGSGPKTNRILISDGGRINAGFITETLKQVLRPEDIGLKFRVIEKSGETEVISSRVFIDSSIAEIIVKSIPGSRAVITYLSNSIRTGSANNPYSFVAALDEKSYPELNGTNGIIINRWLAEDIRAKSGDTVQLTWYTPGKVRELEEVSEEFIVTGVKEMNGIWGDSLLMPEFPGIAGKESCSNWDAGVEIRTDRIREKDEDYWNNFRGTPKAFISYSKGKEIWGSNFGPATAIRFPSSVSPADINEGLKNRLEPSQTGFTVEDLRSEMIRAAEESVDFSALFLGLGFFIIVSCILLLLLSVASYIESRKDQLSTMHALGLKERTVSLLLLTETVFTAAIASLSGAFAGLLVNHLIISALNSVWSGAVQTNTLDSYPGVIPIVAGFSSTLFIILVTLIPGIRKFLRVKTKHDLNRIPRVSAGLNIASIAVLLCISAALAVYSFLGEGKMAGMSYVSGIMLFAGMILLWRYLALKRFSFTLNDRKAPGIISGGYYSFHPSAAVMPVLLIASGLFAVIITGVNRLEITDKSRSASGGTGGYGIWIETSLPVTENLNSAAGRKKIGIDDLIGDSDEIIQAKIAAGNDASCLNLNHIASPPLLGINPEDFRIKGAFSFASLIDEVNSEDPWEVITREPDASTIYGFADQTVLDWGLKKKPGDTLKFRSESGRQFNVVLAGGIKSSLFQGNLIISEENLTSLYPSVPGYSVFLIDCEEDTITYLTDAIRTRLEPFGAEVIPASEKLAAYFTVTNTYLTVFTLLGGLGMILGAAGLGIVLRSSFNRRKREFALMLSVGFPVGAIRSMVFREQFFILLAGVLTGIASAAAATFSTINAAADIPWTSLLMITAAIVLTGSISLLTSLRGISNDSLISVLRRE